MGAEFARLGARTVSIDDGAATERAPGIEHVSHDLRRGLPDGIGRFDLALCLEVAEHLEPRAGERLVAALCSLSPVVLFSAAIPGRGSRASQRAVARVLGRLLRAVRLQLLGGTSLALLAR